MKRYRIKSWVKVLGLCIIIQLAFITFMFVASERFDNIERNEETIYEKTGN